MQSYNIDEDLMDFTGMSNDASVFTTEDSKRPSAQVFVSIQPMMRHFNAGWILPMIFSLIYIVLLVFLWMNAKWFRSLPVTMSPVLLSLIWLLVFVGIIFTWVKCLHGACETGLGTGWIHFWFVTNLLLLLLAGYSFFYKKNLAATNAVVFFTWFTALILCFVATRYFPAGLLPMLFYLFVLSYAWFVLARITAKLVSTRTKFNSRIFSSMLNLRDGESIFASGIFDISGGMSSDTARAVPKKPFSTTTTTKAEARPEPEPRNISTTLPSPLARPESARPSFRNRGLDGEGFEL